MSTTLENFRATLPHGITLTGQASGPSNAPVLLFLHGFPEAAFVWEGMLAHFGTRFRCVAPNLRGYADSSAPPEVEAYRAKLLLADLEALIGQLGAPVEALVAHDWGGAIGWGLGIHRPELARRLVVINAPHPGSFLRDLQSDPAQQAASAYMNFLRRPDAESLLAENDFARLWPFFTLMGGDAWLDGRLRDRYRAVWRQGLTGALNWYRASPLHPPVGPDDPVLRMTLAPEQLRVQLPTTVLWGEGDTALRPTLIEGLDAWVPHLHVVRIPDATHWIVHERPERIAREIETALAR